MEAALSGARTREAARFRWRLDLRAFGAWALAASLVVYLGMRGGGYDPLVRGEVGIAVWWIVLVGAAVAVLPVVRVERSAWLAVGLFALFALWSGVGIAWSSSAERSAGELARLAMYGGVLTLGVAVFSRRTARHGLSGVGTGIFVIAALAVGSRVHPSAFPADQVPEFLGTSAKRLNYPLNYSDGLASFLALGLPVLLGIASTARTIAGRSLAAAAFPVVVLATFLTDSRAGVLAVVLGVVAFYVLAPDRLPKLATGVVAGGASAILIRAVMDRPALRDGLDNAAAHHQGNRLIAFTLVACAGVALVQAGVALLDRHAERPGWMVVPRRRALIGSAAALAVAIVVAVAAGAPGWLHHEWETFKQPTARAAPATTVFDRLHNLAGSRRYQYWTVAADALRAEPLHGIGPGTFEFYWLQHGRPYEFVRNAHSLYMETLAELGIVGLVLLLAVLGWLVAGATRAAFAARGDPHLRVVAAAAGGGLWAFLAGAAFNWTWQIGVIPVTALILGAIGLAAGRAPSLRLDRPELAAPRRARLGLVALAVVALVAIAVPLAAVSALRSSEADARSTDYAAALRRADDAIGLQPYAATPRLQRGLVLEAAGDFPAAAAAVQQAVAREPDNWRLWLVLSRIEAERGRAAASVADYRRARSLDPGSPVFTP